MKNHAALFVFASTMLASCGEPGPHFINCTEQQERDGRVAYAIAKKAFPESVPTFERMRVSCELFDPWPEAECVTWSYPTDTADGLAEFRIDLVGECLLHEAQHYDLRAVGVADGCQAHTMSCAWDAVLLEQALDAYAAKQADDAG
jgi:hypothetical protein